MATEKRGGLAISARWKRRLSPPTMAVSGRHGSVGDHSNTEIPTLDCPSCCASAARRGPLIFGHRSAARTRVTREGRSEGEEARSALTTAAAEDSGPAKRGQNAALLRGHLHLTTATFQSRAESRSAFGPTSARLPTWTAKDRVVGIDRFNPKRGCYSCRLAQGRT
jgi:hypothetical protein